MELLVFESPVLSIACVSDTHNDNASSQIPDADIFVHAGDMTDDGTYDELKTAFDWIASLPHKVKVVVSGNHDLGLDPKHPAYNSEAHELFTSETARQKGIHYLDNETRCIAQYRLKDGTVKDILVYGNPRQPDFLKSSYCFTYLPYPDQSASDAWSAAPTATDKVDIWLMHCPPKDRLDAIPVPPLTGCVVEAAHIASARPLLAVFGHYHSSYGLEHVAWQSGGNEVEKAHIISRGDDAGTKFDFVRSDDLVRGRNTIFANAAWMTMEKTKIAQRNQPWLIKLDLE